MTLCGGRICFAFLALTLVFPAGHAFAQLCSGDTNLSSSITTVDANNGTRIRVWSRTKLGHNASHTTCAGIVGTRSELWLGSTYDGCNTGTVSNTAPTATTSSAYHEKTAARWCSGYWCSPEWQARGRHFFNGASFYNSLGNTQLAGDCGGTICNPCTLGHISGGGPCEFGQEDVCGCCPDPCPLVIDRSGDGLQFSSAEDGALFDINGYGAILWLGWPNTPDDAWLALDRNGNGLIDNGSELFGNTRRLVNGPNARHGYEVLAELDENGDGVVNADDSAFSSLLLWGDANRNGVSEPSELIRLSAAGITSLGHDFRESGGRDRWGNRFLLIASDRSSTDVFPVWRAPDSRMPEDR